VEDSRAKVKYQLNHRLLACSQRLQGIVSLNLPREILEQHLAQFHEEVLNVAKLINEL
jgi:hypothetical protein